MSPKRRYAAVCRHLLRTAGKWRWRHTPSIACSHANQQPPRVLQQLPTPWITHRHNDSVPVSSSPPSPCCLVKQVPPADGQLEGAGDLPPSPRATSYEYGLLENEVGDYMSANLTQRLYLSLVVLMYDHLYK